MTRTLLLYILIGHFLPIYGQIAYNFKGISNIEESNWEGDLQDFIINENEELQLFSSEAGESLLFHKTNIPDSVEILLTLRMDFSPSNSNKLRIYLQIDTTALDIASGYFIEIGENGSTDKISFYRLIDGEALKIAEGSEGLFANDPSKGKLKIIRSSDGLWALWVAIDNELIYQEEFELFDSTIKRHFDQYFGIHCFYTSTRKDKFYFDDIYLRESVPDSIAPKLLKLDLRDKNRLFIEFDEILEKNSVTDLSNYSLDMGSTHPQTVYFNEYKANQVEIEFESFFSGNKIYNLSIENIADLNGNSIKGKIEAEFYLSEIPTEGDLKISEVLFNPFTEGSDFVELYNHSQKILNLENVIIRNASKSTGGDYILPEIDLFPKQYIALTADTNSIKDFYIIDNEALICHSEIPPLNNDEGNVNILSTSLNGWILIDSFDYDDKMHFELIDDVKGLSLERISFDLETNKRNNWHSAGSLTGGATPGFENSQTVDDLLTESSKFELESVLFSPDQDGYEDLLAIHYNLEKDGCVTSIRIFDISGRLISWVVNNQLIGSHGVLFWDGLDGNGQLAATGPYIIHCAYFHADGLSYEQKLLCYLVEKL